MDETQGADAETVETSPASPAEEQTLATQAETSTSETVSESGSAADDSAQDTTEEVMIPKSRFDEVIRERDQYRGVVERFSQPGNQPQPPQNTPGGKYQTFNPQLGYPTDPGEFSEWVVEKAANKVETSRDVDEFSKNYSEFTNNSAFIGAVVGAKRDAMARGKDLTLSQAAEVALKEFANWKKEGRDEALANENMKTRAVVSKPQSKSSTDAGNTGKLSVQEWSKLPKRERAARYHEVLASYSEE